MGFMDTLAISASGMTAERLRMDVVANNLANVNTTRTPGGGPFRREQVALAPASASFGETLAGLSGADDGTEAARGGVQVSGIVPDMRPFKRVYQPGHPDADAEGFVRMPNVQLPIEMVNLMTASRAYEVNLKALQTLRQQLESTLALIRS